MEKRKKLYVLVPLTTIFFLGSEQGPPHFTFSLGPANYAAVSILFHSMFPLGLLGMIWNTINFTPAPQVQIGFILNSLGHTVFLNSKVHDGQEESKIGMKTLCFFSVDCRKFYKIVFLCEGFPS